MLKKSILAVVFIIVIGYYGWINGLPDAHTSKCDVLHQSQNMALLAQNPLTYQEALSAIVDIYRDDASIVKPTRFVGNPARSYVWNDGITQHIVHIDRTSVVSVHTGWNEPVSMQVADLIGCLGVPDFYSTPDYTMTQGTRATSLVYDSPDIRMVISFSENDNFKSPSTSVRINYIRNIRESDLEEFIEYAYEVSEPEIVERFRTSLQPWDGYLSQ